MLELHKWLAEKQQAQTLRAIFSDCWYMTYGCECRTNMVDLDTRNYERKCTVPVYVLSIFRRERRCTTH